MKKYLFLAVAATVFAACSSDSDPVSQAPENGKNNTEVANVPVTLDAYVDRATTRAGFTGDLTTTAVSPAKSLQTEGFGVIAYYTDNNTYDGLTTPNFMYNQHVTYGATGWTYNPVKYWPNEYGTNASSDDIDRVSFFAYAPYVTVNPSNGKVDTSTDVTAATWGITGLSRNSATGDPYVKYIASFNKDNAVDLVWGVYDEATTAWNVAETSGTQTMVKGKPWVDVQRPKDATGTQKLKFTFKHALARFNVQIDALVDDNTIDRDAKTRIYVRSVTFEGFAMQGALNLNNTEAGKPLWLSYDGANDLDNGDEVTIFDGRKDGKEGASAAGSEKSLGLNPILVQDTDWNAATGFQNGVTKTPVNLFKTTSGATAAAALAESYYVIPTNDNVKVTIVYDVETEDANLNTYLSDGKTHGSSIENKITKDISFGTGATATTKMTAGKSYQIMLHLGMNSVKFEAAVTDWPTTSDQAPTDLPANN